MGIINTVLKPFPPPQTHTHTYDYVYTIFGPAKLMLQKWSMDKKEQDNKRITACEIIFMRIRARYAKKVPKK
jgi:hypothetical protein